MTGDVVIIFRGRLRYTVRLGGPGTEIDLFAAGRAKRSIGVLGAPLGWLATGRALDDPVRGIGAHSVQNVNSNPISRSASRGRATVSGYMKRTLRAYLFALISGTTVSFEGTLTLSICAVRPVIVS